MSSSKYTANGQSDCQDGSDPIIGSDNQSEYEAERVGGRLYLNTDNPAQCSGFITQLKYCYYPTESDDESQIDRMYFAIYRRQFNRILGIFQYRQQLTIPSVIHLSGLDEDFFCITLNILFPIRIQQGDIIGACLPERNFLNVVSDISSEEDFNANLSYIESGCSSSFVIPFTVNESNIRVQESRILHLTVYARITGKIYYNYTTLIPILDHDLPCS